MKFRFALLAAASLMASLVVNSGVQAQTSPQAASPAGVSTAKREAAAKLVSLQRGPEMDRMTYQLTAGAVQPVIEKWEPRLESIPAAKQQKARDQLNAEIKTLGDSTRKLIEGQLDKSSETTLLPAYLERFSEEELQQLVNLFEAPAFKKYQTMAPELGNVWVKDVIENTRQTVMDKEKAFDKIAETIVGPETAEKTTEKATEKKPVDKKK